MNNASVWPSAWLVKEIDLRRLAKAALEAKLAACANIVPAIESHYWWEGELESSDEVLLIFKTRQQLLPKLE